MSYWYTQRYQTIDNRSRPGLSIKLRDAVGNVFLKKIDMW